MNLGILLLRFPRDDEMLKVPDELDLLAFFESDPVDSIPEEGYYCYKLVDDRDMSLYFSFHAIEGSIQARLMQSDYELAVISEESADKITIEKNKSGEYLACIFKSRQHESKAEIHIRPSIRILWYTLEVQGAC